VIFNEKERTFCRVERRKNVKQKNKNSKVNNYFFDFSLCHKYDYGVHRGKISY
jgi:hypothetical protein